MQEEINNTRADYNLYLYSLHISGIICHVPLSCSDTVSLLRPLTKTGKIIRTLKRLSLWEQTGYSAAQSD